MYIDEGTNKLFKNQNQSFTGFIPRKEIIQNIKTIQTILTIAIKLTDFKFWRKISKHYNNYRKAIKICYYANWLSYQEGKSF